MDECVFDYDKPTIFTFQSLRARYRHDTMDSSYNFNIADRYHSQNNFDQNFYKTHLIAVFSTVVDIKGHVSGFHV